MPSAMSPPMRAAVAKEVSENDEITLNIAGEGADAQGSPTMRKLVTEYWCAEHKEATLENMLLDSKASAIDLLERPEVLSKLHSVRGLRVLELGAGIGRFTRILAEQGCEEIVAVDFQEPACEENRKVNVNNANVKVICQDATTLDFPTESFDFIFSNWLLMYLSDDEVSAFFVNCLKWLKPGGKLFFRESCMHRSGDAARSFNPSRYRHPNEYFTTALESRIADASMAFCVLEHGRIATYVKVKNNPNQFYWMLRKIRSKTSPRTPANLEAKLPTTPGSRQLLVVGKPATDLASFLEVAKATKTYVHVVSLPNVLTPLDIQALSAVPELFSLVIVEELSELSQMGPGLFASAHFHGLDADSTELRAFAMKTTVMMAGDAPINGLPSDVSDLLRALTDA